MLMRSNSGLASWKSHEALEETMRRDTVDVAFDLHLSETTVRKWKECPATEDDPNQSGRRNPLDLIKGIITTIEKKDPERAYVPIYWLNACFKFLPPIKEPEVTETDEELMKAMLAWVKEFGESSEAVSVALEDGRVSPQEFKMCSKEFRDHMRAGLVLLAKMQVRVR